MTILDPKKKQERKPPSNIVGNATVQANTASAGQNSSSISAGVASSSRPREPSGGASSTVGVLPSAPSSSSAGSVGGVAGGGVSVAKKQRRSGGVTHHKSRPPGGTPSSVAASAAVKAETQAITTADGGAPVASSSSAEERNSDDERDAVGVAVADGEGRRRTDSRQRRLASSQELEGRFEQHLKKTKGYSIKKMVGDGACLFRAVADQVYGDEEMHSNVRQLCMDYIAKNHDHFSQFVTEDFGAYVARKRQGHVHGNNIEMQAIAEMFSRPIEVFEYSTEPINTFQPAAGRDNPPIRLSYHGGVHYNSVIDPYNATVGVGLGLPQLVPGLADANLMRDAKAVSERHDIEDAMLDDKLRATDWEATDEQIQEQIARESYMEWLKQQEAQMKEKNVPCHSRSHEKRTTDDGSVGISQTPQASSSSTKSKKDRPMTAATSRSQSMTAVASTSKTVVAASAASPFDQLPLDAFGLSDWDDDTDVMARILAESQQEYLDSLKKQQQVPMDDDSDSGEPADAGASGRPKSSELS